MSSISSIGGSGGQWAQMSAMKPPSGGPDPAKMFAKVDTDGSGGVDETELQAMLDKVNERAAAMGGTEVSATDAFSSFDTDGDGSLNADELDTGMKSLMSAHGPGGPQGAGGPPPMGPPPGGSSEESDDDSSSSLDKLLRAIDSDKDGNLSAEEIASFKKLAAQVAQAYDGQSQASSSSLCVAA